MIKLYNISITLGLYIIFISDTIPTCLISGRYDPDMVPSSSCCVGKFNAAKKLRRKFQRQNFSSEIGLDENIMHLMISCASWYLVPHNIMRPTQHEELGTISGSYRPDIRHVGIVSDMKIIYSPNVILMLYDFLIPKLYSPNMILIQ